MFTSAVQIANISPPSTVLVSSDLSSLEVTKSLVINITPTSFIGTYRQKGLLPETPCSECSCRAGLSWPLHKSVHCLCTGITPQT